MVQAFPLKPAICCAVLVVFSTTLGCSNSGTSSTAAVSQDVLAPRALSVFYQEFQSEHGGRPPADETEFREFLATRQERLEAGSLTIDKLLTDPQGGTWVVGYGKPIMVEGQRYVAYSSGALDGMRSAINERGGIETIEDAKIQSLSAR